MEQTLLALANAAREATVAALATALPLTAEGGAPDWIRVLPVGTSRPVDGRVDPKSKKPIVWTLADPAAVAAASMPAGGPELALDYDHALDLAASKGLPAPASGWITALEARADGLWAKVRWTPAAAAAIAAQEYRYFSPAFRHTPNGAVTCVIGGALVNRPALPQLGALAHETTGDQMDPRLIALLAAYGLADTASDADVSAAIAARTADANALKAIAAAAGSADASADGIVTAIAKLKSNDAAAPVLEAQVKALAAQVARLSQGSTAAMVDAAITAGKFAPAMRDGLLALAAADPARAEALINAAPVVLRPGTSFAAAEPAKPGTLTDDDKAVCAAMGLPADKFTALAKERVA
jgi:phage I-like protein